MPKFVVERTFPGGFDILTSTDGRAVCRAVVNNDAEERVTWVTSYVTNDRAKAFDVYDAPSPDAIQRAATANGLPIDRISEVRVLDPALFLGPQP